MHLKAVVNKEIALRHPIVALSRNICSLVHTKKLSTLTVAMLRDICEGVGLTWMISQRNEATYKSYYAVC